MGVAQKSTVPTGLLSSSQRAFLRGENDEIENPEQYKRNLRHRAKQRAGQMAEDLALLEEHGHDDIVAQFYHEVDRIERLRRNLGAYPDSSGEGSTTDGDDTRADGSDPRGDDVDE